mgnify:CR=1 FL=1
MRRYFGTDGVRGKAGDYPLDVPTVRRLGAALARLEIRLVFEGLLDRVERVESAGDPERTRSNKHAGYRHAPVRLIRSAR